jgi:pilin isopeptide linkage protein
MDVMGSKMSLATWKSNYFVVTDGDGNTLTAADSEDIGENEYYVTQVDSEEGTAYKIIVPDSKTLHITYLVMVDAAIKETVTVSNKAYFNYDGMRDGSDAAKTEEQITIVQAKGSTGASADGPSFQIYKEDQWGNALEGVTFALYEVQQNSTGAAVYNTNGEVALSSSPVAEKTTDANGLVEFTGLDENKVYCFYETAVPEGYVIAPERTYFYFTYQANLGIDSAIGIDYNEKVFTVMNRFSAASLNVSLIKTINGEEQSSTNPFSFTLKQAAGDTVYADEKCTTEVTSVQTSVQGSGTTSFDTLYFKTTGTYVFTLSEDALTEAETKEGFKKSDVVYTITAKVANGDYGLYMESATYSDGTTTWDLLGTDVPAFDNTLTLDSVTVNLTATKVMAGDERSFNIFDGEFTFAVVEDGEIIAHGKTLAGNATTSEIEFDGITYTQDQLGTHMLTIYEVSGDDYDITYSNVKFLAKVVVEPVEGEARLKATVTYSTQKKENLDANGEPVFTNTYKKIAVPTGIRLNNAPFVIMLALAASFGAIMMTTRRRRRRG